MYILKTEVSDCFTVRITKLIKQSLFVIAVLLKYLTNNWRLIMKLTNLLSVAVATMVGATSLTAMDPEFAPLNPTQAKMLGSHYKRAATLVPPPAPAHHAHLVPLAGPTDTDMILQGITDMHNDVYIAAAKIRMTAASNGWIDGLIGAANMLDAAVAVGGGGQPATAGRNDFKAALNAVIAAAAPAARLAVAANGGIASLSHVKETIDLQIVAIVGAWIDGLIGPVNMLDAGVGVGGPGQPATATRNDFKTALAAVLVA
jgi:hypothetical protein